MHLMKAYLSYLVVLVGIKSEKDLIPIYDDGTILRGFCCILLMFDYFKVGEKGISKALDEYTEYIPMQIEEKVVSNMKSFVYRTEKAVRSGKVGIYHLREMVFKGLSVLHYMVQNDPGSYEIYPEILDQSPEWFTRSLQEVLLEKKHG